MHQSSTWKLLSVLTAVCIIAVDAGGRRGAQAGPTNSESHDVTNVGVPFYQVFLMLIAAIGMSLTVSVLVAGLVVVLCKRLCKRSYRKGQQSMMVTQGYDLEAAKTLPPSKEQTVRREQVGVDQPQECEVAFFRQKAPNVKEPKKAYFRKRHDEGPAPEPKVAEIAMDSEDTFTLHGSSLDRDTPINAND